MTAKINIELDNQLTEYSILLFQKSVISGLAKTIRILEATKPPKKENKTVSSVSKGAKDKMLI